MDESVEDSHFQQISSILQLSCEKCGHQNSLRAETCAECGASIEQKESDRESLSFLHAEGLDAAQAAGAGSHKLKRLKLALEGVRKSRLSLEDYHEVVGQVLLETRAMQEILALQALQDLESKLPAEAIDVMRETADNVAAFADACEKMLAYDGSNILAADEGFYMAEAALADMEATRQEAAELQASYKKKE